MYEIMHAFFSKRGRAGTKGATPTAAEQCAAHMREKRRSSVGALGKECSSISTRAREGSCFPPDWSPFPLSYCCLSLLSWCEAADPSVLNQP